MAYKKRFRGGFKSPRRGFKSPRRGHRVRKYYVSRGGIRL